MGVAWKGVDTPTSNDSVKWIGFLNVRTPALISTVVITIIVVALHDEAKDLESLMRQTLGACSN